MRRTATRVSLISKGLPGKNTGPFRLHGARSMRRCSVDGFRNRFRDSTLATCIGGTLTDSSTKISFLLIGAGPVATGNRLKIFAGSTGLDNCKAKAAAR